MNRSIGCVTLISAALLAAALPSAGLHVEAQVNKNLYSEQANATADIAAAQVRAAREHKRILLDFGGNWCGDCQLLNIYSMQPPNAHLLARHFIVVHVDIGHMDHNMEIARKYQIPVARGVPALAILDARGHLLYAEREKEFEHTSPEALAAFLNHWKG